MIFIKGSGDASAAALGARIRRLRRSWGMSQADLAGDDLSPSYISLLEGGKRLPSAEVLEQLAVRLRCDVPTLTGRAAEASECDLEVELKYAEMAMQNADPLAALAAYRAVQDKTTAAAQPKIWYAAEQGIALALERDGRLEEAAVHYEALRTASVTSKESVPRLTAVIGLCRCYRELGDLSHAIQIAEETLDELRELKLTPTVIGVELLSTLVGIHSERGDVHRASYLASQAIEQATAITDPKALGAAYWNASVVMYRKGNTADALALIQKALAIYAEGRTSGRWPGCATRTRASCSRPRTHSRSWRGRCSPRAWSRCSRWAAVWMSRTAGRPSPAPSSISAGPRPRWPMPSRRWRTSASATASRPRATSSCWPRPS
ncbi:helix-turn-helix domain-containing protein [Streptomyces malaysiensis subsp. malaysiensis]